MNLNVNQKFLALFLLTFLSGSLSRAESIVAGSTALPGTAIMDLLLEPNTPFNPTESPITLSGVSGVGSITINRDAQVGNTINIPTLAGGMFFGSNAILGSYVFGNIAPLTGADFSGSITNVVQNPNDPGFATGQPSSFQSGTFSFGGDSFGFEFLSPGPFQFVKLFTDPAVPFSFSSNFDGLPPSDGTILMNSGPDALNVLFTDPSTGQSVVVAQSLNREIVLSGAVPEPSSIVLLVVGGVGLCRYGWQLRKKI
jgi:PEP-CTERM motif